MSNEKEGQYKPYTPEEPVDPKTKKQEQQEIRDASKHVAQERAAEDLGKDDPPMSQEQAKKDLQQAAEKVKKEQK